MKKTVLKVAVSIFVLALITLIPKNTDLTFGYNEIQACNKEKPTQVVLYEPNHRLLPRATKSGEVRLNWLKAERADRYTVAFGVSSGNYIYGAANVGNTDHFDVRFLTPGKRYYFAVKGANDCMPGPWSREWSVLVGRNGTASVIKPRTTTYKYPTPTVKKLKKVTSPSL